MQVARSARQILTFVCILLAQAAEAGIQYLNMHLLCFTTISHPYPAMPYQAKGNPMQCHACR